MIAALFHRLFKWAIEPTGATTLLILGTLALRLAFAAALGLGFDESYMVAAGRAFQWGYFDHPPIAWWLAWAAAQLAGTDADLVVRFPFILLFSVTTWLMYCVTSACFGRNAGFWAACLLNLIPVLGVTAGSWVLPDGPLLAALLAMTACLQIALKSRDAAAWGWWLAAGGAAGLSLCSKYTGLLTLFGAACFLLTDQSARRWLRQPHPYASICLALLVFSPVLLWNAQHGWVSFLFQSGRAGGRFHLFGPISTLAGEAFFVIPWVWLGAMVVFVAALRGGPSDGSGRWFFACLAAPPIVVFALLAFRSHVLFHWASPGYMMLAPLMGDAIARYNWGSIGRALRLSVAGTAVFVVVALTLLGTEARYDWMPSVIENVAIGADLDGDLIDWTPLRTELAERGLLGRPGLIIAATKWFEAGKIDYALGGNSQVICLGSDPREYGLVRDGNGIAGDDVLIIAPRKTLGAIVGQYGALFETITPLPPVTITHNGRPALILQLFVGHHFRIRAV